MCRRTDIGFSYDSTICYRIGSVSAYFEVLLYRRKRFYWPSKSEASRGFHNGYEIESFFRSGYFYTCVTVSTLIIATINGILLAEKNEVRLSLRLSSFPSICEEKNSSNEFEESRCNVHRERIDRVRSLESCHFLLTLNSWRDSRSQCRGR